MGLTPLSVYENTMNIMPFMKPFHYSKPFLCYYGNGSETVSSVILHRICDSVSIHAASTYYTFCSNPKKN